MIVFRKAYKCKFNWINLNKKQLFFNRRIKIFNNKWISLKRFNYRK